MGIVAVDELNPSSDADKSSLIWGKYSIRFVDFNWKLPTNHFDQCKYAIHGKYRFLNETIEIPLPSIALYKHWIYSG